MSVCLRVCVCVRLQGMGVYSIVAASFIPWAEPVAAFLSSSIIVPVNRMLSLELFDSTKQTAEIVNRNILSAAIECDNTSDRYGEWHRRVDVK